jgi:hypothetical protein
MESIFQKIVSFFSSIRITGTSLYVLIKMLLLGVILAEVGVFSQVFSDELKNHLLDLDYERVVLAVSAVYILLLIFYLLTRGFFSYGLKILKSKRFDILIAILAGVWIEVLWGSFLISWYEGLVASLNLSQLSTIFLVPLVLGVLLIGKALTYKKKDGESTFIPDVELEDVSDDLLNLTERANGFAERVYNNGSPQSFVFGLDAPWGIGKSSFINFCREYWNKKYENDVLVYKFSPLRYAGDANLLDVFIDGLIKAIQKDSFIPEIRPLISRYSRLLKEVSRFSIFGIRIPAFDVEYGVDDAFNDLSAVLSHFDKKVIIVVDDLDRIEFADIRNVLFVIRKSFILPNISYVLCYDTENIGVWDMETLDTEKVDEFLEKFINIKVSLFLNKEDLKKYVSENLAIALTNKLVDPLLVRQAVGGLLDIYNSPKYHNYLPFVGDVRKLKRLINTAILFELESTNFENTDFNKHDLIHLLLIYIHYPNIFRKIYDTETNGGRGFFSVLGPYEDGYDDGRKYSDDGHQRGRLSELHYRNSKQYADYIAEKLPDRPKFLLEQVFNLSYRVENTHIDSVPDEIRASLACFNGGWNNGRNLEAYLDLIVNLSKPIETGQHKFYVRWKDQIFDGSKTMDEVFADDHFVYDKGEQIREKLWRIIVNNARALNHNVGASVIKHLLDTLPNYSLLEIEENKKTAFRHDLDYFITRLLNDAGWIDKTGGHSGNTSENIKEIAEWVFGEGSHVDHGVLSKLSQPDRGVLGLYDLMTFRLFCSADRGGDIFDLTRALALHAREDVQTDGSVRTIAIEEMREISQKVFVIFKEQYIDANKNLFTEVAALQFSDLAGEYTEFICTQIATGNVSQESIDNKVEELKVRVANFIVYQMSNDFVDHGVGCGLYDPTGSEDGHEIKRIFNEYLFNFCFNPEQGGENYEHFLDYLLGNFTRVFASALEDHEEYVPRVGEFAKALDRAKLAEYWRTHAEGIKALNLTEKDKEVRIGNYVATYKKDLQKLFQVLDDFVKEEEKLQNQDEPPQEE